MATVINNPDTSDRSGGLGVVLAVIVVIAVVIALLVYGLPALRNSNSQNGTTIQVPDKVDVNVNGGSNGSGGGAGGSGGGSGY